MKLWLIIILCSLAPLSFYGQVISSVSVSKDSLALGEEFQIFYKLSYPEVAAPKTLDFSVFDEIESLAHSQQDSTQLKPVYAEIEFDAIFNDYENKVVPARLFKSIDRGDQNEIRDTFTTQFWDIGIFQIPHPKYLIDSIAFKGKEPIMLQQPIVRVLPPMHISNPDTTQAILDIKDIIVTPISYKHYLKYLYILIPLLLLIAGLIYYLVKRSKPEEEVILIEKTPDPAHVIALRRLDQLEKEKVWKAGQIKEYQTELTFTLREYLENRYDIPALENTTDEILRSIDDYNLDLEYRNDIKEILQIADMVKFAKAKPTEDIHARFLDRTKNFVLQTKAELVENENIEEHD